ncbi:MAG TPA: hypothetical protein VHJ77_02620 [Vicinamibacterales bacterium]|jgi:hypothetical protein|nr:hypothetical protein [Vicinamibacterales bacterium]
MHTLFVIAAGFGLLGLCSVVGRMLAGAPGVATAALVFLPVWLVGAAINMYLGVTRAGYSVAAEAPIFVIVFGVPAAVAFFTWMRLR